MTEGSGPPGPQADSADRRNTLAADRTVLAAERTYAAWIRTGLGALASGVGARALFPHILAGWFAAATGSVLILFSAVCFVAAVWRELSPLPALSRPEARRLPTWLLIAVSAGLILVDLAALLEIWSRP